MSTSPKPSPMPAFVPPASPVESFPYDVVSPGALHPPAGSRLSAVESGPVGSASGAEGDHGELRAAQARIEGREEGRAQARAVFEEQLGRERSALRATLAQFSGDRAAYFEKVEVEVVQLALAIARKIMHREAQIDPLLLAGMVRVALEKIDGATGVRLRVNPQNAAAWRGYLNQHLNSADLPEILEDPAQPPDRCSLETSMGAATIGLEVQLKEIEQGLMDLLAARPSVPGALS
jgi:flagellar assembly protein FliH